MLPNEKIPDVSGAFDTSKSSGSPLKVIVADDYPAIRDIMVLTLESIKTDRPLDIRTAVNGKEALGLFAMDGGADVIITDCEMPVKNGYELASDIRTIQNQSIYNKNPLIIMISGLSTEEHKAKAKLSGADYVLQKGSMDQIKILQNIITEAAGGEKNPENTKPLQNGNAPETNAPGGLE